MSRVTLVVFASLLAIPQVHAADPKPLWEIDTAQPNLQPREMSWVGFSPDGKLLVAGVNYVQTVDGKVPVPAVATNRLLVWDVATRKEKLNQSVPGFREMLGVERVAMTAEGTLFIANHELRLTDGESRTVVMGLRDATTLGAWLNPKTRDVLQVLGSEDSEYRVSAGKLSAFDAKEGKEMPWPNARISEEPFRHAIRSAVATPELKHIAIATESEENGTPRSQMLRLYAIATGDSLIVTDVASVKTAHRGAIVSSRFSPDGKTLALGSMDCSLSLWDVADAGRNWKPRETIAAGRFTVSCLAFSPDGRTLAAGTYDSKAANLFLIDVRAGKVIASRNLSGSITAVAYSADGKQLVTGDIDAKTTLCKVRVWDAAAIRGN